MILKRSRWYIDLFCSHPTCKESISGRNYPNAVNDLIELSVMVGWSRDNCCDKHSAKRRKRVGQKCPTPVQQ